MVKKTFQPPRGTKDLLPEEYKIWLKIFELMRKVVDNYGYQPVETPAFESFELLSAKGGGGEEIKQQIYYFKDKSGRELGLRFDLTTPIARIVASIPQFLKPIKWYYITRMWRYEKPQEKGKRLREFWQLGVELIGTKEVVSDAEVITVGIDVLKTLNLTPQDIRVFISNRKVLEGFVLSLGVSEDKVLDVFRTIDKKDKLNRDAFIEELKNVGIIEKNITKILELIKLVGEPFQTLERAQEILPKNSLIEEGLKNLYDVCNFLKVLGVIKWCNLDLGIARGLDYYTDTVFESYEIEDDKKIGSSVFGGGRYDNLIQIYGGEPTPSTGWGMGIERLFDLLNKRGLIPNILIAPQVFVIPVSNELLNTSLQIAQNLRKNNISCDVAIQKRSLEKNLEYANKKKIPFVLLLGPRDLKENKIILKDMDLKTEKIIPISQVVETLRVKPNMNDQCSVRVARKPVELQERVRIPPLVQK